MGENRLKHGVVLTMSAEPLDLPAGPLRLLLRLRQLAGRGRSITTLTRSLAQVMGCCTNTIRNWRNVLVDEGYIHWVLNPRTMWVTILIRPKVETPLRQAEMDNWPLKGLPHRWWKSPAIAMACLGGAQRFAPIKPRKIPETAELERLALKWGLGPLAPQPQVAPP